MTSILTNAGAVAALQSLRLISNQMGDAQNQVSSGLRVGVAADNAAYWSIATTMRSDNGAISAVQDALGLGAAQVDTAYAGLESSIDVVQEIKNKLVAASEPGVDKSKIQEEITQLQDQLKSIAASASFAGDNWLQVDIGGKANPKGEIYAGRAVTKQVVGAFARDEDGNVAIKTVNVRLSEETVLFDLSGGDAGLLDANMLKGFRQVKLDPSTGISGNVYAVINTGAMQDTRAQWRDIGGDIWQKGDTKGTYIDGTSGVYLKEIGGAFVDVKFSTSGAMPDFAISMTATSASVTLTKGVSVSELDITKLDNYRASNAAVYLGMGTRASDASIMDALVSLVDSQLETMTSSAAKLGSVSMRIRTQEDFVSKLSDSIDSGVGRLVDAEMNETSTRLKALQTQQQLAVQSLSIANSNAENIMSLFR